MARHQLFSGREVESSTAEVPRIKIWGLRDESCSVGVWTKSTIPSLTSASKRKHESHNDLSTTSRDTVGTGESKRMKLALEGQSKYVVSDNSTKGWAQNAPKDPHNLKWIT